MSGTLEAIMKKKFIALCKVYQKAFALELFT